MDREKLKVLPGGLLHNTLSGSKVFVSAHITNTRLMGVTGLYIHFKLPDNKHFSELHQFFYFDCEEFGFENYHSLLNANDDDVKALEDTLFGGLGGKNINLTLKEAEFLVQHFSEFNRKNNIPLPEGYNEYSFLLEHIIQLTEPEMYILMSKQCVHISCEYELINYFLMRTFTKDFTAANYLTEKNPSFDHFPELHYATFCKNNIFNGSSPDAYINESLVESGNEYYLITTEVTLKKMSVCNFNRLSMSKVSSYEAAMMMARPEFVSVYDFHTNPCNFNRNSTELTKKAMVNRHENGTLYMMFHPNNNHVAQQEYRLNEDVMGIYYVSDSGQLISAAYSLDEIELMEENLINSPICDQLITVSKYEFPDSLLYEYIESDFGDFDTFIATITSGED